MKCASWQTESVYFSYVLLKFKLRVKFQNYTINQDKRKKYISSFEYISWQTELIYLIFYPLIVGVWQPSQACVTVDQQRTGVRLPLWTRPQWMPWIRWVYFVVMEKHFSLSTTKLSVCHILKLILNRRKINLTLVQIEFR